MRRQKHDYGRSRSSAEETKRLELRANVHKALFRISLPIVWVGWGFLLVEAFANPNWFVTAVSTLGSITLGLGLGLFLAKHFGK